MDASPERCWDVLGDPRMTWPRWWPGVSARRVEPRDGPVGSRATLAFRSPLGYALVVDLVVLAAEPPHRVRIAVDGHLHGTADVRLAGTSPTSAEPDGSATTIDVVWRVATTRRWMNAAAPLLHRAFAAAHTRVMAAGEAGLQAHLAGDGASAT
ncbi:SRPBCC family protein [Cellulomonas massiliensis]|uniref:SRPBCC family protein n=1 Tax=Cellulomonas massiliensis TaxID=1465811 RepID=UPI001FE9ADD2|nr:SRPBCC family protein [Cellulomonas massiliensis]